ncbi:SLC13 family permease [Pedomonas sp. V897]|uniref:SLC13 family permease n=1 Tax=Pedomonas sp. V897 TaxID=3446482 RepID=UPI003EE0E97C
MIPSQGLLLLILAGTLIAMSLDRWRYDLIAIVSLMLCVLTGLVPAQDAFSGFGNPAVITVAAVLVISAAISSSGTVARLGVRMTRLTSSPFHHMAILCTLGLALSAFMNNVAALALILPLALAAARRFRYPPRLLLMPLSFATLLGGMITLIGTPPNLLIANFRYQEIGLRYALFDFAPVGLAVAGVGLVYLLVVGWFSARRASEAEEEASPDVFDVMDYMTEVEVTPDSPLAGQTVEAAARTCGIEIHGVVREEKRLFGRLAQQQLRSGDILLIEAETRRLEAILQSGAATLAGTPPVQGTAMMEAVVTPGSLVPGSTPGSLALPERFGIRLLAAARQGRRFEGRFHEESLGVGDVLLLQGEPQAMHEAVKHLGCLPLAPRRLQLSATRRALPFLLFAGAVVLASTEIVPAAVAFVLCVIGLALTRVIRASEALAQIDWTVIVLLGSMIPIGTALQTSGTADTIAHWMLGLAGDAGPYTLLAGVLITTMAITPVLNNPATVILMAPIALSVAEGASLRPDAFLMAVAVGASADFLTPFGHQNNTIIMGPGRYRFSDFGKLGLPLAVLTAVTALAVIPAVWPM